MTDRCYTQGCGQQGIVGLNNKWLCQGHFDTECDRLQLDTKARIRELQAPSYYTRGGIEAFDVIRAWSLDYFRGNVLKYIARAGHKDPAREFEDLEKARVYLDEAIKMAKERGK